MLEGWLRTIAGGTRFGRSKSPVDLEQVNFCVQRGQRVRMENVRSQRGRCVGVQNCIVLGRFVGFSRMAVAAPFLFFTMDNGRHGLEDGGEYVL